MYAKSLDLVAIVTVAVAAILLAFIGINLPVLRLVFGLPLLALLPGYAITVALSRRSFGFAEQLTLSLGLSLAVAALGGVALNYTPWGLQPASWAVFLGGITVIGSVVALMRRRTYPAIAAKWPQGLGLNWKQVVYSLAAVVLLVAAFAVARNSAEQPRSSFTQLWMVPSDPVNPSTVTLGISNDEASQVTYKLQLQVNSQVVQEWPSIVIEPGEKWEMKYNLPNGQAANGLTEAILYRADKPNEIYRRVTLSKS